MTEEWNADDQVLLQEEEEEEEKNKYNRSRAGEEKC